MGSDNVFVSVTVMKYGNYLNSYDLKISMGFSVKTCFCHCLKASSAMLKALCFNDGSGLSKVLRDFFL